MKNGNPLTIGVPTRHGAKKALLLGSGELGREVAIELMRLGCEVIACDRYPNAPAMQVAHRSYTFDMLNSHKLREIVESEQPCLIIPEIEALATDELIALEKDGFCVIPTASATKLTMDREGIRRLASETLELPTAKYAFADTFEELEQAGEELGWPVVIKPIMSSSGKGQSVARVKEDLKQSWEYSQTAGRTGPSRIIVEEFIEFESEITLLTVRSSSGTSFCAPIGHRQEGGDYVESWQPHAMTSSQITRAQALARAVTDHVGGYGVFGVELFLLQNGDVLFSEVSPRPHDTGMVTMATQFASEFALHARAVLGLPVGDIPLASPGASFAIKSKDELKSPVFQGIEGVFADSEADLRIFSKPAATVGRRLGVVLVRGKDVDDARSRGAELLKHIVVVEGE